MAKNKGRISRYLANKCSIASRIDCFSEFPTTVFGDAMKQQVEDRLKFYETGEVPKKNNEVMGVAVEEVSIICIFTRHSLNKFNSNWVRVILVY